MKTFEDDTETIDGSKFIKHGRDAPAWMVTYADLMSLLFALFVLLLSFSVVDDNSFKKNAGPMREAFNQNSDFETDQESIRSGGDGILPGVKSVPMNVVELKESEKLRAQMVQNLRSTLSRDLDSNLVELEETANGAILRFPSRTTFESGGAELSGIAFSTLQKIVPVLARVPGEIKVGGHTDNVPISTLQFRSNWDLSTARANSVVHYLLRSGKIRKERLTTQGYADSRPLEPNTTNMGKNRNRRVEIAIEIPDDPEQAKTFIDETMPKRRLWKAGDGQKEIAPGTKPVDTNKKRKGGPVQLEIRQ